MLQPWHTLPLTPSGVHRAVSDTVNDERAPGLLEMLRAAVGHLSLDAEKQLAYLDQHGVHIDELALELDEVALAAVSAPGLLTATQAELVTDLHERLDDFSGTENTELWTAKAVRSSSEWADIRERARRAAAALR